MNIDALTFDNRRGRSEAVLGILQKDTGHGKDFNVDHLASGLHVVGEDTKRPPALPLGRCRQPYASACNNRRGPTAARDWRFPENILRLAPLQRESLLRRVTFAVRSAKLRPVLGEERNREHEANKSCSQESHAVILPEFGVRLLEARLQFSSRRRRERTVARGKRVKRAQPLG